MKRSILLLNMLMLFGMTVKTFAQENINTEFLKSARYGEIEEVKIFLTKGADINFIDEDGYGAGEYAIWAIDEDKGVTINYLLDNGLDIKYKNDDGQNLLHIAADYEARDIFKKLIDKGILINDFTDNGETAIFIAAESEDYKSVNKLVELGANVQLTNKEGESIIDFYDLEDEEQKNDLLSFDLSKAQLGSLLFDAVWDVESIEFSRKLIDKGADVNFSKETNTKDLMPVLHAAAQLDDISILKLLIENGANVNSLDDEGYNVLWETETIEGLELLINKGADINQIVDDESILMNAVYWGDIEFTTLLVNSGADVALVVGGQSIVAYAKTLLKLENRPGAKYSFAEDQIEANKKYKVTINQIIKFLKSKGAK